MRRLAIAALVALSLAASWAGRAQAQLVDRGYSLDVIDLPVLGSSRALGLGGAYASAGEGITAVAWNPAAIGRRTAWENDWFEWDIALGAMFPSGSNADRYFGSVPGGGVNVRSFQYWDVGFRLQFGPAAFSTVFRPRLFTVKGTDGVEQSFHSEIGHVDLAWSFLGGQLVVGAGLRVLNLRIERAHVDDPLLEMTGVNFETGATFAPYALPFRAALAVRAPIEARPESNAPVALAYAIPAQVVLPWEVSISGTYGFGPRPLNPVVHHAPRRRVRLRQERLARRAMFAIVDAADPVVAGAETPAVILAAEAEEASTPLPVYVPPPRRRYGFVTADLVIQGRVDGGIGLDGFLTQTERRWGRRTTASPRIGVEGEPWLDRMKLRGGVYLEPHRSELANPRVHFTSGFDLRLFTTDVFGLFSEPFGVQVSFATDVSKQYFNFGLGVGFWH